MERERKESTSASSPVQMPMDPRAGFLVPIDGAKPDKPGERMRTCLVMHDLTYRERVVLAEIAWHDGRRGAFPSQESLGVALGLQPSRVSETLKMLRAKGRLRWRRRHGHRRLASAYSIAYGKPDQFPEKPEIGKGEPISGKTEVQSPVFQENNLELTGAPRSGNEQGRDRDHPDVCHPSAARCRFKPFPGGCCKACGWERPEWRRRGPARPGGRTTMEERA